jgi:hypothetical protein
MAGYIYQEETEEQLKRLGISGQALNSLTYHQSAHPSSQKPHTHYSSTQKTGKTAMAEKNETN